MKRGTPDHPKLGTLMMKLRIRKREAVGILELMFHFTARYCPQGDIGKVEDDRIAAALDWDIKKAAALIDALQESGFLEEMDGARLYVHDWHDHADDAVRKYLMRTGLKFYNGIEAYQRRDMSRQVATTAGQVATTAGQVATTARQVAMAAGHVSPAVASASASASPCSPSQWGEASGIGDLRSETDSDGDEAHRILVGCPELRGLTWAQDRMARQFAPGLDYLKAAISIVKDAMLMARIENPGAFVKAKYLRLIAETDSGKKEGGRVEPGYVPLSKRGK